VKAHIIVPFLVGVLTWGCAGKSEPPMPSPAPPPQNSITHQVEVTPDTFIEVHLEGGGVFGGADPVTGSRAVIGADGKIVV
jgi:hypothetical protein